MILRPFNTFGPYQSSKAVVAELTINMLCGKEIKTTPGEQTREFLFVADTVSALIKAAETDEIPKGPVNIAGGKEVKIADLVRLIHELTGCKTPLKIGALPYRPNEMMRMCSSTDRALEVFGWEAKVPFEKGIKLTVDWYRKNLAAVS